MEKLYFLVSNVIRAVKEIYDRIEETGIDKTDVQHANSGLVKEFSEDITIDEDEKNVQSKSSKNDGCLEFDDLVGEDDYDDIDG